MKKLVGMVGKRFGTNYNGFLTIIEYKDSKTILVRFDSTGYEVWTGLINLKKGTVKDRLLPNVCGVGYVGEVKTPFDTKCYKTWHHMIERCYDLEVQKRSPTYIGCEVSEDWHNYQNFRVFYEENYIKGYHLDKDLLVVGNKLYSKDTCVFVPQEINCFVTFSNASRGKYPLGVSYNSAVPTKPYRAEISSGKGKSTPLGSYTTVEDARRVWLSAKLKMAEDYKALMDSIDRRIYPNTIEIIKCAV